MARRIWMLSHGMYGAGVVQPKGADCYAWLYITLQLVRVHWRCPARVAGPCRPVAPTCCMGAAAAPTPRRSSPRRYTAQLLGVEVKAVVVVNVEVDVIVSRRRSTGCGLVPGNTQCQPGRVSERSRARARTTHSASPDLRLHESVADNTDPQVHGLDLNLQASAHGHASRGTCGVVKVATVAHLELG